MNDWAGASGVTGHGFTYQLTGSPTPAEWRISNTYTVPVSTTITSGTTVWPVGSAISDPPQPAVKMHQYGWECPRCQKIWGPHIAGCTCDPSSGVLAVTS